MKKIMFVLTIMVVLFVSCVSTPSKNLSLQVSNNVSKIDSCKGIGSVAIFTVGKTTINDIKAYIKPWCVLPSDEFGEGIDKVFMIDYNLDGTISDHCKSPLDMKSKNTITFILNFYNDTLYKMVTTDASDIIDTYILKYGKGIKSVDNIGVMYHTWDNGSIFAQSVDEFNQKLFTMYDKNIKNNVESLGKKLRMDKI